MYNLYIFALMYGFLRSLISNFSILRSIKILTRKYKSAVSTKDIVSNRNYFILIPLLREQESIPNLLNIFGNLNGDYELIFITTHKEEFEHKNNRERFKQRVIKRLIQCKSLDHFLELSLGYFNKRYAVQTYKKLNKIPDNQKELFLLKMYDEKPLTKDLLKNHLKEMKGVRITVLEYPKTDGVMAHQLNYACEHIRKEYPNNNNLICIYNADSEVQKDYLKILDHLSGNIIQQSSLFLRNFQRPSETFRDAFLKGNGMLQSRWTLAHEIPRIHSQRESNPLNFLELSHVVGHGLAIKLNTLKKVGDFPTQFSNEDLPLGYMLRINNEFVDIYPSLENSDSPSTIKNVFAQYRTWFYGVAYYPRYFLYALSNFNLSLEHKLYALLLSARGVFRSFQWLLTSVYWIFILAYPFFIPDIKLFFIAVLSFLFYSLFSWFLTFRSIEQNPNIFRKQEGLTLSVLDWLSVFPVYLTHSWGPFLGSIDVFKNVFMGTNLNKRKTER